MSDKSNIEWTDATWNPVTGCTEVSPGCAHCYAKTFAERWRGVPGNYFEHGFDVQLRPNMLERPLHWTRPRRIFVNSMSDLFHEAVPDEYIDRIFAVMWLANRHTFQVLTKRIERAASYLAALTEGNMARAADVEGIAERLSPKGYQDAWHEWPLSNVLIGPTVENQHFADVRLPILAQIHDLGWRTMVSYEPALGPVNFWPTRLDVAIGRAEDAWPAHIDWLICGGESGPKHRPFDVQWARSARDQARGAGIPFFMKQLGGARPGTALEDLPEDLRVREFPS